MIYKSKLWSEDLDGTLASLPELETLAGSAVMITGAAGLICSAVTDLLIRYNETHGAPIRILAAGRWPEEMENRFGDFCKKPYFTYVRYDAAGGAAPDAAADYIIHGAGNAFPALITAQPVETMLGNFTGLYGLLQSARARGTKRVLYISSSEVYGKKESAGPFREDEYGFIDLLNPRNAYSVGKRAAETLCASFAAEYGVESVIVRPGHIYGPTASPNDNRVASAFAYAAARGEDIVMKSDGAQLRSLCHCLDCASAMLRVLLRGESGRAYNISNPDSVVTIREMAALLAAAGGVRLIREEASAAEKAGFNPMLNSSLDSAGLQSLGWRGRFDAPRGLARTVEILREIL